jgi:hypothetical protein
LLYGYADTQDDFDRFSHLIRAMDEAYCSWRSEKLSKKGKIGDGKKPKEKPAIKGKRHGRS